MRFAPLLVLGLVAPAALAQPASFEGLGHFPGASLLQSRAHGVSADGRAVAGAGRSASGLEAFRWEGGVLTGLGDLPGGSFASQGHDISAGGAVVVGESVVDVDGTSATEAFRWTASGGMQGLGFLVAGAPYSIARAVSADGGVVVGEARSPQPGSFPVEAFRWEGGVMVGLGDLPGGLVMSVARAVSADGAVVVGLASDGLYGPDPVRWVGSAVEPLGALPGARSEGVAHGVSADGRVIVGEARDAGGFTVPFRWEGGAMTALGPYPCDVLEGGATAVSADGAVVVGGVACSGGTAQPFVWTAAAGPRLLYDVLGQGLPPDEHPALGWTLGTVTDVSADGRLVVGFGMNPQGEMEAWRAVLPGGPTLTYTLAVRPERVGVGDTLTVVVRATNGGGAPLTDVRPTGPLAPTSPDGGAAHVLTGPVPATLPTLAAGATDSLAYTFRADAPGTLSFFVGLRGTDPAGQPVPGTLVCPPGRAAACGEATVTALRFVDVRRDTALVPGTTFRIRWEAPATPRVDLLYTVARVPDAGSPANTLIAADLDGAAGEYVWTVPDTLSPHVRLLLRDHARPEARVLSTRFRIKPYWLTRLRADSTYERFRPGRHGWAHNNTAANWWPPAHWQAFDYTGVDPHSGLLYTHDIHSIPHFTYYQFLRDGPVVWRVRQPYPRQTHPEWGAIVRAFGTSRTYRRLVPGVSVAYSEPALVTWRVLDAPEFAGVCYGMTVATSLAFGDPARFGAAFPSIGPVTELRALGRPGRGVIDDVTTFLTRQLDRRTRVVGEARVEQIRTVQRVPEVIEELRQMLLRDDRSTDYTLAVRDPVIAHSVFPYRMERTGPGLYRVYYHDPNTVDSLATFLELDSTANRTRGTYHVVLGLQGPTSLHYQEAELPDPPEGEALAGGGPVRVYVHPNEADVRIESAAGVAGWGPGGLVLSIEGAVPRFSYAEQPTRPFRYELPAGSYRVSLTPPADTTGTGASFWTAGRVFGVDRLPGVEGDGVEGDGVAAGHAALDHVAFDPSGVLSVGHEAAGPREFALWAATEPAEGAEHLLRVDTLMVAGADSVRMAVLGPDGEERLALSNAGASTAYRLTLRHAEPGALRLFVHEGIALHAGATHTAVPDWADLSEVPVLVDDDGDGVPEDTLTLANEAPGEHEGPPGEDALGAPYPNPARGAVAIPFDVAEAGGVRLAVYDPLGREVALLLDEHVGAGHYEVAFHGAGLASGVYVVRLTAGSFSSTRTLTLTR